jgi:hypothetical protein
MSNSPSIIEVITDTLIEPPQRRIIRKTRELFRIFRHLPASQVFVDEWMCALTKDILLQGWLYLTTSTLCFHSNIFGFVTKVLLPFGEIVAFEKRTTALLIPNAILVTTREGGKYLFTSFTRRDETYGRVVRMWEEWRAAGAASGASPAMTATASMAAVAEGTRSAQLEGATSTEDLPSVTGEHVDAAAETRGRRRGAGQGRPAHGDATHAPTTVAGSRAAASSAAIAAAGTGSETPDLRPWPWARMDVTTALLTLLTAISILLIVTALLLLFRIAWLIRTLDALVQ